ncbi:MAG: hypothetical protein IJK01_08085 [Clostridia bacterium]|nr:hypothetical protein [Clostridia bacterium]
MSRIAVIDIGSNSVRYMEAERTETGVLSLSKELNTTRLAEGQDAQRTLMPEPMRRTADAVLAYAVRAKADHIPVYAYATSALREASNRDAFLSLLGDAVPVTVLSGAEEGRMAYSGATGGNGTLIDIGGGSFQIVTSSTAFSAPIGCVRLKDRIPEGSPEELYAVLRPWADTFFTEAISAQAPITGVGGTITTLGALLLGQTKFDGAALKNAAITPENLKELLADLYAMGERRKAHPLLNKRHNVILQGGTILRYLMERLRLASVTPCDRDGMEGFALYEIR